MTWHHLAMGPALVWLAARAAACVVVGLGVAVLLLWAVRR